MPIDTVNDAALWSAHAKKGSGPRVYANCEIGSAMHEGLTA